MAVPVATERAVLAVYFIQMQRSLCTEMSVDTSTSREYGDVPTSSSSCCLKYGPKNASYVDPLGPQIERPKTAAKKQTDEDDFADEELGDDLLPE
ncbi:UNVERIFIED_CONTAM: hypothetical protein FKN15_061914 [Acipenser sinensis]